MFLSFFYLLRRRGLNVSLNEWMTLLEGMEKGLHQESLTGFYRLCRAVLLKSESEFDLFDRVFLEFFKNAPFEGLIPDELMDWLEHPMEDLKRSIEELKSKGFCDEELDELLKRLEERIKEQDSQHNGGNYWVGTQGTSAFGNNGWHPNGIRIGGKGQYRTAMMVAGERKYRDFRRDNKLDSRQFQMAFKLLRQYTSLDNSEKEFDVDQTIHETSENAGMLKVCYKNPRRNMVKVLLLMDSGGSMDYYSQLCSMLFQAAEKSKHFKELHTFYFHNCVYENVYEDPALWKPVATDWLIDNFDSSYKVIIVGDAAMSPYELNSTRYDFRTRQFTEMSGMGWLLRLKKKYPHLIWLNPDHVPTVKDYWTQTQFSIAEALPMYELTLDGLTLGIKHLLNSK